jgi:hypothetical protein
MDEKYEKVMDAMAVLGSRLKEDAYQDEIAAAFFEIARSLGMSVDTETTSGNGEIVVFTGYSGVEDGDLRYIGHLEYKPANA